MSGFVLHPDALTDLIEIWEYIAADNPAAADYVLEEIHEAIRALVPYPQLGHSRADLTSRPLRFHPVRNFLVAYAPNENRLLFWRYSTGAAILASSQPSYAQESKPKIWLGSHPWLGAASIMGWRVHYSRR
jgi:plasmid stabilization system protein ParE